MLLEECAEMLLVVAGDSVFVPDLLITDGGGGEAVDGPGKAGGGYLDPPLVSSFVKYL